MKKTLKTVVIVLALEFILGAGYYGWVLSTPDDVLSTVAVSRDWIGKLGAEVARQQAEKRQMQEQIDRLGSTLELLIGNGARRV